MLSFTRKFFILFFVFISAQLFAQYPSCKQFRPADGLPSAEVYAAIEDDNGYMWFATDAGISRYDGYTFTNYTVNDGMGENVVFQLLKDERGRIWCRGATGTIFYFENNQWIKLRASETIARLMKGKISIGLAIDKDGTAWLSFPWQTFKLSPPYTSYQQLITQNNYQLHDYGMSGVDIQPVNNKVQLEIKDENGASYSFSKPITGKQKEYMGRFFYSCKDKLRKRSYFSIADSFFEIENGKLNLLYTAENFILGCSVASDGNVWFSVADKGVYSFNPELKQVTDSICVLSGERCSCIFHDNQQGAWLTVIGKGVLYFPDANCRNFSNSKFGGEPVVSLTTKGDTIFALTRSGNFAEMNATGNKISELHKIKASGSMCGICDANDGILMYGINIFFYNTIKKTTRKLPFLYPFQHVTQLSEKKFFATSVNFCYIFNYESGEVLDSFKLPGQRIRCVFHGADNDIWIGCSKGLFCYRNDSLENFTSRLSHPDAGINSITMLQNGNLVMATSTSGLLVLDQHKCLSFSVNDGLPSALCTSLQLVPGSDKVWVGGRNNICLLDFKSYPRILKKITTDAELTPGSNYSLCLLKGKLWIATDEGVQVFDTSAIKDKPVIFPLYFNTIHINDKPVTFSDHLEVPYNENSFQMEFTAPFFRDGGKTIYRYRMLGNDTAWVYQKNRLVRFPQLSPGNYTFEVQAIGTDNSSFSTVKRIHILVRPPFWNSWWFYSAVLSLLFVLIVFITRLRIRSVRRDAEIKYRLVDMELKALRTQMNPHFVFNAFNSMQHLIRNAKTDVAGKYLDDFSRLLRNVLEQSKSEMISLEQELEALRLYLAIEQLRFGPRLTWDISITPGLDPTDTLIPPMLLQPFVENSLYHGLLEREKATLKILIREEEKKITCIVEDNGIGRKAAALKRVDSAYHSRGMQIVRERLQMMNVQYGEEPKLIIDDLSAPDGTSTGTRITLQLPFYFLS